MRDVLATHFTALQIPNDAQAWLLAVWDVFQGLDDWVDGTPASRDLQDRAIWHCTVGLSLNPFFAQHAAWLQPVMANAVLKWQAADWVERHREHDQYAKSYVWRASYYDLVLQVLLIVHGFEAATKLAPGVMRMYGETLADYLKEFDGA